MRGWMLLVVLAASGCWGSPPPANVSPPNDPTETNTVATEPVTPVPTPPSDPPPTKIKTLVELTPRAAAHVKQLLAKAPEKTKLRISLVEKFGGDVRWNVTLTAAMDPFDDEEVTSQGIVIVLDRATRPLIAGTTVDYEPSGNKPGFRFQSPQLKKAR